MTTKANHECHDGGCYDDTPHECHDGVCLRAALAASEARAEKAERERDEARAKTEALQDRFDELEADALKVVRHCCADTLSERNEARSEADALHHTSARLVSDLDAATARAEAAEARERELREALQAYPLPVPPLENGSSAPFMRALLNFEKLRAGALATPTTSPAAPEGKSDSHR